MKYLNKKSKLIFAAIALSISSSAQATLISDNYIGGNAHGYGDVIGDSAVFDIKSMDITRTGNMLSVDINTNFAGKGDDGFFKILTNGLGIGYGDLFLSSSWMPYGTAPYSTDNNSNGTVWNYGFSLDNRWMAEGAGTGTLYSLNSGNNDRDALLSEDFLTGGTFRNGQEIAVDLKEGDITRISGTSRWSVDNSSVNFLIDLTGTSLENSSTVALHWGMTCGNDTIEGQANLPVKTPEPAILGLLALGMIGIGASRRRKI